MVNNNLFLLKYFNFLLTLARIFLNLDAKILVEIYVKESTEFFEEIIKSSLSFFTFGFPLLMYNLNLNYNQLINLSCIDNLNIIEEEERFSLIYILYSLNTSNKISINISFNEENLFIPSLTQFYKSLFWLEREIFDMFGIIFIGNTDLRRILTDYGFKGHPLKKDFPLTALLN